jgi:hypothetical protein
LLIEDFQQGDEFYLALASRCASIDLPGAGIECRKQMQRPCSLVLML